MLRNSTIQPPFAGPPSTVQAPAGKKLADLPPRPAQPASALPAAMLPHRIESLDIDLIQPYPGNDRIFPPCGEAADGQLRASLLKEGQRDPLHVMPAGNAAGLPEFTLLDGHRRRGELKALGATHVDVIVRSDLLTADRAAVHGVFLSFNRDRRQLDPLALAVNLREAIQANRRRPSAGFSQREMQRLVQQLVGHLQICPRNAQRYAHGANAPAAVQSAYRNNLLRLDDLAKVGMAPPATQQLFDNRIKALPQPTKQDIAAIIRQALPAATNQRPPKYTAIAVRAIKRVAKDLAALDGGITELHGPTLARHRDLLVSASNTWQELIAASNRPGQSIENLLKPFRVEDAKRLGKGACWRRTPCPKPPL